MIRETVKVLLNMMISVAKIFGPIRTRSAPIFVRNSRVKIVRFFFVFDPIRATVYTTYRDSMRPGGALISRYAGLNPTVRASVVVVATRLHELAGTFSRISKAGRNFFGLTPLFPLFKNTARCGALTFGHAINAVMQEKGSITDRAFFLRHAPYGSVAIDSPRRLPIYEAWSLLSQFDPVSGKLAAEGELKT
jgi:hypothetical protein